jgi:hypothetical protein
MDDLGPTTAPKPPSAVGPRRCIPARKMVSGLLLEQALPDTFAVIRPSAPAPADGYRVRLPFIASSARFSAARDDNFLQIGDARRPVVGAGVAIKRCGPSRATASPNAAERAAVKGDQPEIGRQTTSALPQRRWSRQAGRRPWLRRWPNHVAVERTKMSAAERMRCCQHADNAEKWTRLPTQICSLARRRRLIAFGTGPPTIRYAGGVRSMSAAALDPTR